MTIARNNSACPVSFYPAFCVGTAFLQSMKIGSIASTKWIAVFTLVSGEGRSIGGSPTFTDLTSNPWEPLRHSATHAGVVSGNLNCTASPSPIARRCRFAGEPLEEAPCQLAPLHKTSSAQVAIGHEVMSGLRFRVPLFRFRRYQTNKSCPLSSWKIGHRKQSLQNVCSS